MNCFKLLPAKRDARKSRNGNIAQLICFRRRYKLLIRLLYDGQIVLNFSVRQTIHRPPGRTHFALLKIKTASRCSALISYLHNLVLFHFCASLCTQLFVPPFLKGQNLSTSILRTMSFPCICVFLLLLCICQVHTTHRPAIS